MTGPSETGLPNMHYFTAQIRREQEPSQTLRASHYGKRRKLEPENDDDVPWQDEDDDDYVPPPPFPHAPAKASRQQNAAAKVQEEMANLPSPIYAANAGSKVSTLGQQTDTVTSKKRHLNVLTAVMHRCLLEGDYERAGRAWGIILRTQVVGGQPVDPRNHGRWGIGAEILLHRKPQPLVPQSNPQRTASRSTDADMFSEEGFALAREYYERMIVQHPNSRTHPHVVDERFFYPAMFSLWIFEICEKSKSARKKAQEERAQQSRSSRGISFNSDADDAQADEASIKLNELAQAKQVADRLDQLVISPPFDKDPNLLLLRGNVGLWISDLVAVASVKDRNPGIDSITRTGNSSEKTSDYNPDQTDDDGSESYAGELTRLKNSHRELQHARRFLQRAAANGAQVQATTISNIELKSEELTRQIQVQGGSLRDDDAEQEDNDNIIVQVDGGTLTSSAAYTYYRPSMFGRSH